MIWTKNCATLMVLRLNSPVLFQNFHIKSCLFYCKHKINTLNLISSNILENGNQSMSTEFNEKRYKRL